MKKMQANTDFDKYLDDSIKQKKYVKLQYFTDIQEFISIMTIINDFLNKDNGIYLSITSGEEIPLDKVVKLDDIYAPKYVHIDDYTCDC